MAINKMIETALGRFQISTNISDDGPLVVFLSGAGQFDTLATYHNVITQLPASVNWLTVDYLNTGYSGTAVKDYTLTDEARAIADIIHTQAAAGVILVAHSLGGVYALVMAEQLKNVAGFVGIEPTTREIVLNPPQTAPISRPQRPKLIGPKTKWKRGCAGIVNGSFQTKPHSVFGNPTPTVLPG
ncbi:alpha/beta hydrolase [Schleiferilactobacillus harbinensis]|uniref:Alpha/beta hydrolase n=1 Tax=Schleiferilactobacillus harbinensis TaxID=304207 RepID=A0ABU7T008_9LACO